MENLLPPDGEPRTREEIRDHYERIVTIHRPALQAFLTRYLADATAASDVAQEAFVRAYFQLDRYDDRRPFSRWLFTIAGNLARDFLRQRARRERHLEAASPFLGGEENAGDCDDEGERLDRAIAALPDGLREPIVLHYQLDWSLAEIARHLDLREGAVKGRLHRARERLRDSLNESRKESHG